MEPKQTDRHKMRGRLEVRVDSDVKAALARVAAQRGTTVSVLLRDHVAALAAEAR